MLHAGPIPASCISTVLRAGPIPAFYFFLLVNTQTFHNIGVSPFLWFSFTLDHPPVNLMMLDCVDETVTPLCNHCCSYCRCEFKLPVILDKNSKTKLSQGDEDDLLVIHAYSKVGLCVCVYDYQVFLLIFLWFWRSQKSTGMGKRMRLICWLLPDLYE